MAILYFKVRCETLLSQQVFIVGSIKELGNWNITNSLQLYTNNSIYPVWMGCAQTDMEENSLVEFKAIIKSEDNITWEDGENRVFQLRYQEQTIIFQFNSSFLKLVRIASFENISEGEQADLELQNRQISQDTLSQADEEVCSESEEETYSFFLCTFESNQLCIFIEDNCINHENQQENDSLQ